MLKNGVSTIADFATRRQRRNTVNNVIALLTNIRDAEQNYLENVPENLQNSESFEIGEYAVDALEEIIDMLVEVY